jgi:hypothetical protein
MTSCSAIQRGAFPSVPIITLRKLSSFLVIKKVSKVNQKNADKKAGDFSGVRAFFCQTPISDGGCTEPTIHLEGFGGIMKAKPINATLFSTFVFLGLFLAACTPKCIIKGRVVDAETQYPIEGAAVAIRWYENQDSNGSAKNRTIGVDQGLSDAEGTFKFPHHQDKNYVMGVYKEGYICWSSRSSFSNGARSVAVPKTDSPVQNDMVVQMERLKGGHSEDQHASFTVLVAEEVTTSKQSPFYQAIKPLFKRWRDNLREEFKKTFSRQRSPQPELNPAR